MSSELIFSAITAVYTVNSPSVELWVNGWMLQLLYVAVLVVSPPDVYSIDIPVIIQ